MKINVKQGRIASTGDDLIVLFVSQFAKGKSEFHKSTGPISSLMVEVLNNSEFLGKKNQKLHTYTFKKIPAKRILLVGLGEEDKIELETLRRAASGAISFAKAQKIESLSIEMPNLNFEIEELTSAVVEGASLSNYSFNKYKTEDKKDRKPIKDLTIVSSREVPKIKSQVRESVIICNAVCGCRNLVNENASVIYPESFAKYAKKIFDKGSKITVFDEKRLQKEGMGLLYAVGMGSVHQPRLLIVEYKGDPKSKKTNVLVGKGITYDTGGYNIKPSGFMETMRCDMAGASTVLHTIKALSDLKAKVNVVGLMSLAENCVSDRAYKPGDTFTSYSGLTVEIGNTDAEGRLAMADALSYSKTFKPESVIDVATLTGASVVAVGEHMTSLFSNDDEIAAALEKSSKKTYDRVWRMPMYDEIRDLMKSDYADIKNIGANRYGGAIQAAVFLEKFVPEKVKWAHLDIAGPAFLSKANFYNPTGGTGHGVRLLVDYFRNL